MDFLFFFNKSKFWFNTRDCVAIYSTCLTSFDLIIMSDTSRATIEERTNMVDKMIGSIFSLCAILERDYHITSVAVFHHSTGNNEGWKQCSMLT